ncbi:MAG TPA: hypothetical protein VG275_08715 [Solirubrobacteraceae bacterium]|nr:hypothetical protein [Solirubrobacteraceae bacterium]
MTLLSVVVGVVLFVILVTTVAVWWVAAISGLGVILVASLFETAVLVSRENREKGATS